PSAARAQPGRGGDHADAQGQAQGRRREIRAADRGHVRRRQAGGRASLARDPVVRTKVHLELLAVQLLFAGLAIVGTIALRSVPANAAVLVRVAGSAAPLVVLARARGPLRIARRDLPLVVACAILGVAANQLLFMNGLQRTTAVNATVI